MKRQTTFFVWTVSLVGYIFALIIQSSTIAAQDGFRAVEAVLKAENPATIITKSENSARLKVTNYNFPG